MGRVANEFEGGGLFRGARLCYPQRKRVDSGILKEFENNKRSGET
jgi:hypothetical protein